MMNLPRDPLLNNSNQNPKHLSGAGISLTTYCIQIKKLYSENKRNTEKHLQFQRGRRNKNWRYKTGFGTTWVSSNKLKIKSAVGKAKLPKAPSRCPTPESPRKGEKREERARQGRGAIFCSLPQSSPP
jgi:hypothetical protein